MPSRTSSNSSIGSSSAASNDGSTASDTDAPTPVKTHPCKCQPSLHLIYQLVTTSLPAHSHTHRQFYTKFQLQQLSDNPLTKLLIPPTVVIQNAEEEGGDDDESDHSVTLYHSDASSGTLQRQELSSTSSTTTDTIIDLFTTYSTLPPPVFDKRVHECLVEHEFEAQRQRQLQELLQLHPPKCPNKVRMLSVVQDEAEKQLWVKVKMLPRCIWRQMAAKLMQLNGTSILQATQPTADPQAANAHHHHHHGHAHAPPANTPLTIVYNTSLPITQQLHLECKTRQLSRSEIERVGLIVQNLITHCNAVLPYAKPADGKQLKPTIAYTKLHLLLNTNNELVLQYASALQITTVDEESHEVQCYTCRGVVNIATVSPVKQLQLPCTCEPPKPQTAPKRSTTVWSTAPGAATKAKLEAAARLKERQAERERPKTALEKIAATHDTKSLSKFLQKTAKLSDDARELLHWKLIVDHRVSNRRISIMPSSQSTKQLHSQHTASTPNLKANGNVKSNFASDNLASAISANRHARLNAQKKLDQTHLSSIIAKRMLQSSRAGAKRPSTAAARTRAQPDD